MGTVPSAASFLSLPRSRWEIPVEIPGAERSVADFPQNRCADDLHNVLVSCHFRTVSLCTLLVKLTAPLGYGSDLWVVVWRPWKPAMVLQKGGTQYMPDANLSAQVT